VSAAGEPLAVGVNLLWMGEGAGGIGRYARELLPALLEVEPDTRLVAFVGRDAPEQLRREPWALDVEWVRLPVGLSGPPVHLVAQFAALPALSRRHGLDVLHSPANVGPALARGVATIVTIHDLIWLRQGDLWEGRRAQRSMRRLCGHAARRADRLITDSVSGREDCAQVFGVTPERIDVVHLGVRVPEAAAVASEDEVRRRFELREGRVLLCVAQKRPYKNLGALVRALSALPENVRLVLAGEETPYEAELRGLAEALGVADRVRFPSWVSDAELEGLYRLASAFVLPSLMEGFGLPVLEAMARGVPVACSDRPALPEVAGGAALLFDPEDPGAVADAARRLLEDPQLADDLRGRGRERAAKLTWAETARGTLAAYRRALARR
jgi:glycosyltransferase involved in cell wall biosynthesis